MALNMIGRSAVNYIQFMKYKKIPLSFGSELITLDLKQDLRFSYGDTFFEYNVGRSCQDMLELFLPKLDFKILPDRVSITRITAPGVGPHCDTWPVSLNFYLSTGNGTLLCYNMLNDEPVDDSKVYNLSELELVEKVNIEQFDLILLNTHQVHSVDLPIGNDDRYIFRFIWSHNTFDEVAEGITIKTTT